MRGALLIFAAAAAVTLLPAAPAAAQSRGGAGFGHQAGFSHSSRGVRVHRGDHHRGHDRRLSDDFRSDDGRDRNGRGDAYLPYRDYQGDTLWRSDSFNDWWHDRPDRAYPRWIANNQDCQRQYWAGGGWRC